MSAPARAYTGELRDIGFEWAENLMLVQVAMPRSDFDGFTRGVGTPRPDLVQTVAVMACRARGAFEGEDDVLAHAALDALIEVLARGHVRLTASLLDRLGQVMTAADANRPGRQAPNLTQAGDTLWPTTP